MNTRRVNPMKMTSKKRITLICLVSTMLMLFGSLCSASRVTVGSFQQSRAQIETNSIACDEYNPPVYKMSADLYWSDASGSSRVTYRYNYDKGTMYMHTESGRWQQIDKDGSSRRTEFNRRIGLVMFRTAYNMDFPLR